MFRNKPHPNQHQQERLYLWRRATLLLHVRTMVIMGFFWGALNLGYENWDSNGIFKYTLILM
jgi:hypothetical protein